MLDLYKECGFAMLEDIYFKLSTSYPWRVFLLVPQTFCFSFVLLYNLEFFVVFIELRIMVHAKTTQMANITYFNYE